MRLIHWILVKVLARTPGNSTRDDDSELFLIWCLIHKAKSIWDKFIMTKMIYYRDNLKRPIYFSLFVMMILQFNGIESDEEYIIESPNILGYGFMSKMSYYKDLNSDYYYLEDSGKKISNNKILEKEVT